MKKFTLLILVFITYNLFGFEIVKTISLESIADIDYQRLKKPYRIYAAYNKSKDIMAISLPTTLYLEIDKTVNFVESPKLKRKKFITVLFNKEGKFLGKVGNHGGFGKEDYKIVERLHFVNDELQIAGNKLLVYDTKEKPKFKYYAISDSSDHILLAVKDKCFGERPAGFNTTNTYRDKILSIYPDLDTKSLAPGAKSFVEVTLTGGAYLETFFYILKNNEYFVINNFGSDLLHFNSRNVLVDSIFLDDVYRFRINTLNHFAKIKKKGDRIHFPMLENFFIDEKNDRVFIVFQPERNKDKNRYLYVYSLKNNTALINFQKIDFYPVTYDEKKDQLIALKIEKKSIKVVFYKI